MNGPRPENGLPHSGNRHQAGTKIAGCGIANKELGAVLVADGSNFWEVAEELSTEYRRLIEYRLLTFQQKKVNARRAMKQNPPGGPVRAGGKVGDGQ